MHARIGWMLGALGIVGVVVVGLTVTASAQLVAPTESKGVSARQIGSLSLAQEIDRIDERQLRMRIITLAPGGILAPHGHRDRPSVEYILQGSATEFKDGVGKQYHAGDAVVADKNTTHWWRNDDDVPVIVVASDIYNPVSK